MSRYVDLDGKTWDGTLITSKIQEVQTKHGYMSGITVGWLWGDNVPHIDLEEHDAEVKAEAIEECLQILHNAFAYNDYCVGCCDGNECDGCFYTYVKARLDELKEQSNEKKN